MPPRKSSNRRRTSSSKRSVNVQDIFGLGKFVEKLNIEGLNRFQTLAFGFAVLIVLSSLAGLLFGKLEGWEFMLSIFISVFFFWCAYKK